MKSRANFEQPTSIAVVRDMFNGDFVPNFKIGTGSGTFDCPGCGMILGSLMVCGKSVESFNEQDFLVVGHVDPVHPDHGSAWVEKCPLQNKMVDLSKVRSRDLLHGIPSWMYWDEAGHRKPNWLVELEYMEKIEDPGMEYETPYLHGETGKWRFSKRRYAEYERVKHGEIVVEAIKLQNKLQELIDEPVRIDKYEITSLRQNVVTADITFINTKDPFAYLPFKPPTKSMEFSFENGIITVDGGPIFRDPFSDESLRLQAAFYSKYRKFIPNSYTNFCSKYDLTMEPQDDYDNER